MYVLYFIKQKGKIFYTVLFLFALVY